MSPASETKASTEVQVCGGHAEAWFCGRNHLPAGFDNCIVCCFEEAWKRSTSSSAIGEYERRLATEVLGQRDAGCPVGAAAVLLARAILDCTDSTAVKRCAKCDGDLSMKLRCDVLGCPLHA
jgi:hypothetical protein